MKRGRKGTFWIWASTFSCFPSRQQTVMRILIFTILALVLMAGFHSVFFITFFFFLSFLAFYFSIPDCEGCGFRRVSFSSQSPESMRNCPLSQFSQQGIKIGVKKRLHNAWIAAVCTNGEISKPWFEKHFLNLIISVDFSLPKLCFSCRNSRWIAWGIVLRHRSQELSKSRKAREATN